MDDTNFIDLENNGNKSSMVDEHQIIKIVEKKPTVPDNIGKIVNGDSNSNILTFEINRYYDGVDLCNKLIKIIIKNDLGIFTENTVDVKYTDDLLRFSWILSSSVTYKAGTINVAIIFIGNETDDVYALKTLPFNIIVDNSLDFSIEESPYKDWYIDIENELFELKKMISNSNISGIELHEHLNKNILDKLSLSDQGNLLYDGKEIVNSQQPLSAYDIAVENGFNGTKAEWLDSLKGQQGDKGIDGISPTALDVATQLKSDTEFVNSLKGEKGEKGDKGDPADDINLEILDSIESVNDNTTCGKLVDSLVIKEVFQSVSEGKRLIALAIIKSIQGGNGMGAVTKKIVNISMPIPEGTLQINDVNIGLYARIFPVVRSCEKVVIPVVEG